MLTIAYLKNEILLPSSTIEARQLVHCELVELEEITLQCLMLKPVFQRENCNTNKLTRPVSWSWKAMNSP